MDSRPRHTSERQPGLLSETRTLLCSTVLDRLGERQEVAYIREADKLLELCFLNTEMESLLIPVILSPPTGT